LRLPNDYQLDLEMAFASSEDVMNVIEDLVRVLWSNHLSHNLPDPFPRLTYKEAMSKYGSDKPDLRLGYQISRLDYALPVDLVKKISSLEKPAVDISILRCIGGPSNDPANTTSFISRFLESPDGAPFQSNPDGGPGIFIYDSTKPLSGLSSFGFEAAEIVESQFEPSEGDLVILQARPDVPFTGGSTTLGRLILALHQAAVKENILPAPIGFHPLWVTDFPLFTPSDPSDGPGQSGTAGLSSTHHPFTSPKTAMDVDLLLEDPTAAIADHYDLVMNGTELGGGSRRIHNDKMQRFIMEHILKMPSERVREFDHLLGVLRAGCPPHAGIALGFDRLIAVMLGRNSVRDVIAFPKWGKGEDPLVKAPSKVTTQQLGVYGLAFRPKQ
jgi:aspartyl-tRNA synthetase